MLPSDADPAGRRANGLPATDWGALVDLDPRLSEGLLDRLAEAGVAAYVEPATAVDTVHRAVVMPGRPLDRLWVDPDRADSAREVVSSEVADLTALLAEAEPGATAHGLVLPVPRYAARRVLAPPALPEPPARSAPAAGGPAAGAPVAPGPGGPGSPGPAPATPFPPQGRPTDDELFAQIIADYDRLETTPTHPWPAAEDLPATPPATPDTTAGPVLRRRRSDPPVEPSHWLEPDAVEDDGHFVPPPPPPVPRVRLRTLGAVLAVVLGVLLLFAPRVLGLVGTQGVGLLGLVLLTGGAGALVWWVRDGSSGGPDDGAVV